MKKYELCLEPLPYKILKFGLIAVIFSALYTMSIILNAPVGEYITTRYLAIEMTEYSLMTMLIVTGGSLLLDYCIKKDKRK